MSSNNKLVKSENYSSLVIDILKPILITTKGFKELLILESQLENNLFISTILIKNELFDKIVEVDEFIDSNGTVLLELKESAINKALRHIYKTTSVNTVVIALLNSRLNPSHEIILENILRTAGYTSIYISHKIEDPEKFINKIK
jgi:5-oxoprolinase (ATP-hydrolysing)